jgi:hypothetical protein
MSAQIEVCRKRVVAVLASGVVISLTALTGGTAPAYAKPDTDPISPTTVVVPPPQEAPPQEAPPQEAPPQVVPTKVAEAPAPPAPQKVAEAPTAPPSVESAPAPRAIEAPPTVELAPQTQVTPPPPAVTSAPVSPPPAPVTTASTPPTSNPPTSSAVPPAPPKSPPSPAVQTPVTSIEPSVASSSPPSKPVSAPTSATAPAPESTVATSASPVTSASSAPPSPGPVAPAPIADPAAPAVEASPAQPPSEINPPATSTVSQAAKVIDVEAPKTLQAPQEDVVLAKSSKPLEATPDPAPKDDVDALSSVINLPKRDRDGRDQDPNHVNDGAFRDDGDPFHNGGDRNGGDRNGDHHVQQWDRNWVEYDDYYRPVICNPYRDPVRIIYVYQNSPRIVIIPPLARIVLEVAQLAAYSFTAVVTNAVNQAVDVAVGSFFGGGYYPGVGLPPPPPPPPFYRYDNVPVQVRYSQQVYQPFRVQRIVDVGDDAQYGERKVLLDGVTPAWGEWTQTPAGERQFEVHKTQQFPGLDEPREGPLPGDYQLRLASDESSSGLSRREVYLIATAVVLATLSLGAVAWSIMLGRRRRQH